MYGSKQLYSNFAGKNYDFQKNVDFLAVMMRKFVIS
jgi:hypothetical protein